MPTLPEIAQNLGLGIESPITFVLRAVQFFLGLLGLIAVILILYAGFQWMTSAGNPEKIASAKKILKNAVIGLAIILTSLGIVTFLWNFLSGVTGGEPSKTCEELGTCDPGCVGDDCERFRTAGFNVIRTDPEDGKTDEYICKRVQAIFNGNPQIETVRSGVTIKDITEGVSADLVPQAGEFTVNANAFSFERKQGGVHRDWEPNRSYEVDITRAVKDERNRPLQAEKKITFTTGIRTDTQSPSVIGVNPALNKDNVCLLPNIQIEFSETIDTSSVDESSIFLHEKGKTDKIPYRVSFPRLNLITINPTQPLKTGTEYVVEVKDIQDSCGNKMAAPYSWSFTTTEDSKKLYCEPTIHSLDVKEGYYQETLVSIRASDIGLGGEVEFNGMPAGSNSFDNKTNITCWAGSRQVGEDDGSYSGDAKTCGLNEVKVRVPINSTTGSLQLKLGYGGPSPQGSNYSDNFTIKSPYIASVSPAEGALGQFVTIFGYNFGSVKGAVNFTKLSNNVIASEFPNCDSTWSNNQIIIKVPKELVIDEDAKLEVVTGASKRSNQDKNFIARAGEPGPGICGIDPNKADKGDPFIVTGEKFGTSQQLSSLNFGSKSYSSFASWADTNISGITPSDLSPGTYAVNVTKVLADGKNQNSNSVLFTTPKSLPIELRFPYVIENRNCSAGIQSPSPFRDQVDACTNARLSATFSLPIRSLSFNNNILVDDKAVSTDRITPLSNTFLFDSPVPFALGAHKATLKGSADVGACVGPNPSAICSESGLPMLEDYPWQFNVLNECRVNSIGVAPSDLTVTPLEASVSKNYEASGQTKNCNMINMCSADIAFNWTRVPQIEDISPDPTPFVDIVANSPSCRAVATIKPSQDIGKGAHRLFVKAAEQKSGKIGTSRLVINNSKPDDDPDSFITIPDQPLCDAKNVLTNPSPYIGKQNVCTSAIIEVNFSSPMNRDSLTPANLVLRYINEEDETKIDVNRTVELVMAVDKVVGAKIIPDLPLSPNASYEVEVKGGAVGVAGTDGKKMQQSKIWTFTTKSNTQCEPDSIVVQPIKAETNGQDVGYDASAANQCVLLKQSGIDFSWTTLSDKITLAKDKDNSSKAVASVNAGITGEYKDIDINVSAIGKTGTAKLDIKITGPLVAPKATIKTPADNVCRNADLEVEFDQLMDLGTFKANSADATVNLKKGSEDVPIELRFAQDDNKTILFIKPKEVLASSADYYLRISNQLKGKNGKELALEVSQNFSTADKICRISTLDILPSEVMISTWDFYKVSGQARSSDAQALTSTSLYSWAWDWAVANTDLVDASPRPADTGGTDDPDDYNLKAKMENGRTTLNLQAKQAEKVIAKTSANVEIDFCGLRKEYKNADINFESWYCRDGGVIELNLVPVSGSSPKPDLLSALLTEPKTKDAIGIQVWTNTDHLSPMEWYLDKVKKKVFSKANPQTEKIGQWSAVRDGSTVFISGPGGADKQNLYTNIYVLSYNIGAGSEIKAIYQELLNNMRFLALTVGEEGKIARDMIRLADLGRITRALEKYKISAIKYPALASGTYINYMSTSKWPISWPTLGKILGITIPQDPLNDFAGTSCKDAGKDPGTCYKTGDTDFSISCPAGSHLYQYMTPANDAAPQTYSLYANFEYKNATWRGAAAAQDRVIGNSDSCTSISF